MLVQKPHMQLWEGSLPQISKPSIHEMLIGEREFENDWMEVVSEVSDSDRVFSFVCTQRPLASALQHHPRLLLAQIPLEWQLGTCIIVGLLFIIIMVLAQVVFLIIFIFKTPLLHVIIQLLKLKSLASEPVDSPRDELLLDVLSQLVVKLETFLDITCSVIVVLITGSLRW